ncbi:hypothetical protein BDY17DRAFT_326922 [Neohortaea acidophila]|uniref:Uncharacterized protein n=1 Tax=Neohortaea acidophila TaxID=245834 RepID=A0A6A6PIQ2_9PEZI|nr:uncharacterized protein BDY17DRAFT_326922 [Neohortaea acidophila]KAF2479920.1 hypothetical protein BDY17DRAFT_326922 [Neohortaea acidophila]
MDPTNVAQPEAPTWKLVIIRSLKLIILGSVVMHLHPHTGTQPETPGLGTWEILYLLKVSLITTTMIFLAVYVRRVASAYRQLIIDELQRGDELQPSPALQPSTPPVPLADIQYGDASHSWAIPPQSTLSTIPEETHHSDEAGSSATAEQSTPSEPRQADRSDSIVDNDPENTNDREPTPSTDESEVIEYQPRHEPHI